MKKVFIVSIHTLDDLKPKLSAHATKGQAIARATKFFIDFYNPDLRTRMLMSVQITTALGKFGQWYDEKAEIVADIYDLTIGA